MKDQGSGVTEIKDNFAGYDKNEYPCGKFYTPFVKHVLVPEKTIRERTKNMAAEIHRHYGDKPLMLLCVLKGGCRFFNLLLEELQKCRADNVSHPMFHEFIRLKSYENTQTTNTIKVIGPNPCEGFRGINVLVVEDIVDTGKTLEALSKMIHEFSPASVAVATMCTKRLPGVVTYKPDFAGFSIPNEFVIGFGLDYNEYFREMNNICVINQAGIEKFKI
jgi:hypoxanthine phosphoribosyltransferase